LLGLCGVCKLCKKLPTINIVCRVRIVSRHKYVKLYRSTITYEFCIRLVLDLRVVIKMEIAIYHLWKEDASSIMTSCFNYVPTALKRCLTFLEVNKLAWNIKYARVLYCLPMVSPCLPSKFNNMITLLPLKLKADQAHNLVVKGYRLGMNVS